jgi:hypothetical protein
MNNHSRLSTLIRTLAIWPVAALLLVGCSKAPGVTGVVPVTGKVTYNGQPVEGALVSFIGEGDQRPATALTAADGTFALTTLDAPGALPGKYVAVVHKTDTPPELTREISMEEAAAQADKPLPQPKPLLPSKYDDPAQSPLKFEVKPGADNTFDLPLAD